jgi:hypothetical protein
MYVTAGLALVKQAIENDYKGTITVTSSPNLGTLFTLTFKEYTPQCTKTTINNNNSSDTVGVYDFLLSSVK